MKIDLHVHSRFSGDAVSKPSSIIKAAIRRGLNGIAVTDHNSTGAWKEMKALSKRFALPVILGEEIKTEIDGRAAGEIIGLFLNSHIERSSPAEVVEKIKEQGGVAVLAHPFDRMRGRFRDPACIARRADAAEVFNARSVFSSDNRKAAEFAERHGLAFTAGSDAHTPFEVGNAYTVAKAYTLEEFRKALEKRKTAVFGRKSSLLFRGASFLAKAKLRL